MTTDLAVINNVDKFLAQAENLEDILEVRDLAKGASVIARARNDFEQAQRAKIAQLKSERAAGKWLKENVRHEGGRPSKVSPDERVLARLPDGIDHNESHRWQTVAELPDQRFNEYLDYCIARGRELYSSAVYALAKNHIRKKKREELIRRARAYSAEPFKKFRTNGVYLADIRTLELPESSVDMIFTDPPYDEESVELYLHLARMASTALKPGGYVMTYTGKSHLPAVMDHLGTYLEYVWEYGVFQPDSNHTIQKHHVFHAWRPILAYKRPGETVKKDWQPDMIKATRDKEFHEWQQQIEPPMKWIDAYTSPGDLVVDPFVGGGTTLVACVNLKRRYLGFDIDPDAVRVTQMRLKGER